METLASSSLDASDLTLEMRLANLRSSSASLSSVTERLCSLSQCPSNSMPQSLLSEICRALLACSLAQEARKEWKDKKHIPLDLRPKKTRKIRRALKPDSADPLRACKCHLCAAAGRLQMKRFSCTFVVSNAMSVLHEGVFVEKEDHTRPTC